MPGPDMSVETTSGKATPAEVSSENVTPSSTSTSLGHLTPISAPPSPNMKPHERQALLPDPQLIWEYGIAKSHLERLGREVGELAAEARQTSEGDSCAWQYTYLWLIRSHS